MKNPVDFDKDIPNPTKLKEIIFYKEGLKIYGVLPYILARKLKGEFISSNFSHKENNFTIVGYQQKESAVQALVDWLYKDAGMVWAVSIEKLYHRVADRLPEVEKLECSFGEAIAHYFGVTVRVLEPKSWDVVLGNLRQRPKNTDAVLGGSDANLR